MADPNNIPQEAQQLKEDLNSENEETSDKAKSEVASTDFEKEYDIAEHNKTGPGTQTSNPSAVGRKGTDAGDHATNKGQVDDIDSPGDSDPDDYMDMAKDVTKNVDAE
ncbi:MAG: hypothetical protein WA949_02945 [Phormidesmis sp.]